MPLIAGLEDQVTGPTLDHVVAEECADARFPGTQRGAGSSPSPAANPQVKRTWCTGQYGIEDVYVGVPARLGRRGVEEIVELDLIDEELAALRRAAEGIRAKCADLASLG